MSDYRTRTARKSHLIVRTDHILCTQCFVIEPIHQGHGTPMDSLICAYELMAARHQDCRPAKELVKKGFCESCSSFHVGKCAPKEKSHGR